MWLLVNSQLKAKGFQNTKKAKLMVSKPFLRGHLRNDHDIDKPLLTLNQSVPPHPHPKGMGVRGYSNTLSPKVLYF